MKITGILLAGGLSKRMGREKGLVRVGNKYLYQYPLRVLESVCNEILISSCKPLDLPEKHPVICDEIKGIGPLGGIHACLQRSSSEHNIVVSYDLPMINRGLIQYLIRESKGYIAVFPALGEGRPEPLCALFHRDVLEVFNELIDRRDYAIHSVIPLARSRILPIDDKMPFYHPDIFLNINRKEDLEKLPERFGDEEET